MESIRRTAWHPSGAAIPFAIVVLVLPVLGFAFLKVRWEHDGILGSPNSHFYVVSAVAALASVLAVTVIRAA